MARTPPNQRRSLAELAGSGPSSCPCPSCGSGQISIYRTSQWDRVIVRYCRCSECRQQYVTKQGRPEFLRTVPTRDE